MTTNTHILMLGAGIDQVSSIKIAKDIGYIVTAVDSNELAPGKNFCDFFYPVSNRDIKVINRIIANSSPRITTIFLMGSDIPEILDAIKKSNSLTGFSIKDPYILKNKFLMKKHFSQFNIPIPKFKEIYSIDDFTDLNFGSRVVLKPMDSSGSRGVNLIDIKNISDEELSNLIEESRKIDTNQRVMVEEFLEGPQISSESLIVNNQVHTFGFALRNYEDTKNLYPNIIENGGIQPAGEHLSYLNKVDEIIGNIADSLNISNGVIKGDLVISGEDVKVIEVAFRLSGGDFSETLIPISTNFNFVEAALRLSANEKIILPDQIGFSNFVANRYFFGKKGKIISIEVPPHFYKLDWLIKLDFFKNVGDDVLPIKSHADRLGVFVIKAQSLEELEKRINYIYESISITIE